MHGCPRLLAAAALSALAACSAPTPPSEHRSAPSSATILAPSTNTRAGTGAAGPRGFLLISIDTLRADRVGAYGYHRPTTPFLDRLAERGTLFEQAIVQYPGTLQSHMSIFTGLYPGEHGVFPPALKLSPQIPTLPELFHAAGFRTGGRSEGGFVKGYYGFSRGFDEWSDPEHVAATDLERTLAAGRAFLARLKPDESFFLFLHTYAVHDPYTPPDRYRRMFGAAAAPPDAFPPDGVQFARVNERGPLPSPQVVAWLSSLYDASIRYTDDRLAEFFAELEKSGLLAQTVVVITADHGEEFLEHGHLSHVEPFHETLHVPLLVLLPGQKTAQRVHGMVESIDIAPTLLELAGLPAPAMSGRSFAAALRDPRTPLRDEAFAEGESWFGGLGRVLYRARGRELLQLVHTRPLAEPDGAWVSRRFRFDFEGDELRFDAVGFPGPRAIGATVDRGKRVALSLGADWQPYSLPLGSPGLHQVELVSDDCRTPRELGRGDDPRCLSFKVRGVPGDRLELFELNADPLGQSDLSRTRTDDARALLVDLHKLVHSPRAPAEQGTLEDEHLRSLRALGYLH